MPDSLADSAKLYESLTAIYNKLSALEKQMIQIFAIAYEPINRSVYFDCLLQLGLKDKENKHFTGISLKGYVDRFLKLNLNQEEKGLKDVMHKEYPEILAKHFIVENENVIGKSLKDLNIRFMTKAVVSRIKHNNSVIIPENEVILHKGDVVRAVGSNEALERIKLLLGKETLEEIPLDKKSKD
jgi:hypothetical protein